MRREQVEGVTDVGVRRRPGGEVVGGVGDAAKAVDRLGRRAAGRQVAEHLAELAGQAGLVVPVFAVALATDLVEEEPAELEGQLRVGGVERDAAAAEQFDAAIDPAPAPSGTFVQTEML